MTNPLIDSLTAVVAERPGDTPLRLHLAELLIADGRGADAVPHLGIVLASEPTNERATALMRAALGVPVPGHEAVAPSAAPAPMVPTTAAPAPASLEPSVPTQVTQASGREPEEDAQASSNKPTQEGEAQRFDWRSAEEQVGGPAPAFVNGAEPVYNEAHRPPPRTPGTSKPPPPHWPTSAACKTSKTASTWRSWRPCATLNSAGSTARASGAASCSTAPPGCGKTYIARALAGEIGASFITVTLTDILDQFIGNSEANLHSLFVTARKHAPVVLFLDEIDAIGQKRSRSTSAAWRGVTNQLLMEMDGIGADNEGVFILAATNTPWDVDPALRRPGRFDRSVAVLPPDAPARHSILYHYLKTKPMEGIDLGVLVRQTSGFTGADLAHLVDSAAEFAMMDSLRTGTVRMMTMQDFANALKQVRPSAGPWFASARNIVEYGNRDGQYDDLAAYMKANKLL